MRLPTVRVKHPALGFITINASDLTEQHELHDEQAADFDAAHLHRSLPVSALDPALRDAAAALCLRMVALRRRVAGEPFANLPPADQIVVLQEMAVELERAESAYEEDQRERAAFEASERQRAAVERDGARDVADGTEHEGAATGADLRVAKGPGGRWYVYRGEERVSKGFATEPEAAAEVQQASGARDA